MSTRHEALRRSIGGLTPVATETAFWRGGMQLDVATYIGEADLPDELVVSVRCVVTVGDRVLVFEDASDSTDVLPGGRREAGESWQHTAQREVMEETGWHVDEASLTMLGFIHLQHVTPVPVGHRFPHPDFLQVVMHGEADAAGAPDDWVDVDEGYVRRSWLAALAEAQSLALSAAGHAFLGVIATEGKSQA